MGDTYPTLKVAAVQAAPVYLDREATVEKACRLIKEAGAAGADLVAFPECFIPGYPHWYQFYPTDHPICHRLNVRLFKNAVEVPGDSTTTLCRAAKEAGVYVNMGLNEKRPGLMGTMYNGQLFIHRDGTILGKHQKLMPTVHERLIHGLGDGSTLRVFDTEYGPMGCLCCGENGNPLFRFALMSQGEVVHVANWPAYVSPYAHRYTSDLMLLRARNYAFEAKAFVVSPAGLFSDEMADTLELDAATRGKIPERGGASAVHGPGGQCLAGPAGSEETIVYADVNLEEIIDARIRQDLTGHYNRFDVVSLNYNPGPTPPLHFRVPRPSEMPPTGQPEPDACANQDEPED